MTDNPTILRAVDADGSQVTVYPCTPPTWGWQFTNSKRHEFDYGWALSKEAAIEKSQKLLKPDQTGKYPEFQAVHLKTDEYGV